MLSFKRFAKQMEDLENVLSLISNPCCPAGSSISMLLLLGPSPSRPREALELTFSSKLGSEESVGSQLRVGDASDVIAEPPVQAISHKALARLLRQVIPAAGRMPVTNTLGAVKLFVLVKAPRGCLSADAFEERTSMHLSYKKCVCLHVHLDCSPSPSPFGVHSHTLEPHQDQIPMQVCDGQHIERQSSFSNISDLDLDDKNVWHFLRAGVKGLKCCDS